MTLTNCHSVSCVSTTAGRRLPGLLHADRRGGAQNAFDAAAGNPTCLLRSCICLAPFCVSNRVLVTCAAFTFLNPHVCTSAPSVFAPGALASAAIAGFGLGAVTASAVWFATLWVPEPAGCAG